jgi:hypothetical protein
MIIQNRDDVKPKSGLASILYFALEPVIAVIETIFQLGVLMFSLVLKADITGFAGFSCKIRQLCYYSPDDI